MTKSATVFINHLANAYGICLSKIHNLRQADSSVYRANEVTTLQNKKTIMPADVFRALDDIEYGFMRERVEAEFASAYQTHPLRMGCRSATLLFAEHEKN